MAYRWISTCQHEAYTQHRDRDPQDWDCFSDRCWMRMVLNSSIQQFTQMRVFITYRLKREMMKCVYSTFLCATFLKSQIQHAPLEEMLEQIYLRQMRVNKFFVSHSHGCLPPIKVLVRYTEGIHSMHCVVFRDTSFMKRLMVLEYMRQRYMIFWG